MHKKTVELRKQLARQARRMRSKPTEAEHLLWMHLRNRRLANLRFRRQHVVRQFILDFYCHEAKLAIELDGDCHKERRDRDHQRDELLRQCGIEVLRFWNREVLEDLSLVLAQILQAAEARI